MWPPGRTESKRGQVVGEQAGCWDSCSVSTSRVAGCRGGWHKTAGSKEISESGEHLSERMCV